MSGSAALTVAAGVSALLRSARAAPSLSLAINTLKKASTNFPGKDVQNALLSEIKRVFQRETPPLLDCMHADDESLVIGLLEMMCNSLVSGVIDSEISRITRVEAAEALLQVTRPTQLSLKARHHFQELVDKESENEKSAAVQTHLVRIRASLS
jgi:hypothetical protein